MIELYPTARAEGLLGMKIRAMFVLKAVPYSPSKADSGRRAVAGQPGSLDDMTNVT
ncbi:MAG: hypothetical protein QMD04_00850 [Anaerolineales bacterium]|nr:hypothetical protein [Anaerolineales bacterium]